MIFIDGQSTDNTCEIIDTYSQKHPNIKLLHNPHRFVPYSLNIALQKAQGDIIIRLDAHTEYAPDYFERIMETFGKSGADIVGGPTTQYSRLFRLLVSVNFVITIYVWNSLKSTHLVLNHICYLFCCCIAA